MSSLSASVDISLHEEEASDLEDLDRAIAIEYTLHPTEANNPASVWHYFYKAKVGNSGKCMKCGNIIKAKKGSTSGMRRHLIRHKTNLDDFKQKKGLF